MKYDLKRLKQAADERIPEIPLDESILDRALERRSKRTDLRMTRALTALAACVIVFAVLSVMIAPGLTARPDDTGDGDHLLSQGIHSSKPTPEPMQESGARQAPEEDLSVYQIYGPDYAISALPDEKEFGDVVIRKLDNYDKTFVFEDEETGERVIPGQFDSAYAWFPATETGLVQLGPNEGLTLINVLRETLDGQYSYFQYMGNGVAVVAQRDEDETEPDPMYLISTADGTRLSRDYETIGTMHSGEIRLMMGHDDQSLYGDFDVLAMDGRVIARVSELSGVYFSDWLAVRLPGEEDYCLIDYKGNVQLGGMRFSRVAYEKDDMMIVWTDEGSGIIRRDGSWVFEPGRYFMIEFAGNGLFRAIDMETGEFVQINEKGEKVDTLSFRLGRLKDEISLAFTAWKDSLGTLGFIIVCLTVLWLILRIGWSKSEGELQHMLITELGFAAYIAGLILIGHRLGGGDVVLWPTDTSVEGARALSGQWMLLSFALTASLIAAFPKLRGAKKAFLTGYALMLLPWAVKAACGDVSVMGWRAFSEVVFFGGALMAALLYWIRPVKRFMAWCARFDSLNEYGRVTRRIWAALIVLAMVNFGAGCLAGGQELVRITQRAECDQGVSSMADAAWFDEVNRLSAEYRESGWDQDCLDLEKHDYSVISAVQWLKENDLTGLTEEMVYSVYVTGVVELRRAADTQLLVEMKGQNIMEGGEYVPSKTWQIITNAPLAGAVGPIEGSAVFLVPPGEELPDIEARLYIRQRLDFDGFIAAQRYYQAKLGTVLNGDTDSADQLPGY